MDTSNILTKEEELVSPSVELEPTAEQYSISFLIFHQSLFLIFKEMLTSFNMFLARLET